MKEWSLLECMGFALLVALVLSILFEGGLLVYGFLNADKVECNLLWCTFTKEKTTLESLYESNSRCYINGLRVNCSEHLQEENWTKVEDLTKLFEELSQK